MHDGRHTLLFAKKHRASVLPASTSLSVLLLVAALCHSQTNALCRKSERSAPKQNDGGHRTKYPAKSIDTTKWNDRTARDRTPGSRGKKRPSYMAGGGAQRPNGPELHKRIRNTRTALPAEGAIPPAKTLYVPKKADTKSQSHPSQPSSPSPSGLPPAPSLRAWSPPKMPPPPPPLAPPPPLPPLATLP